ncbi:MAG: TonB-dependent receptor [Rhodanobacter sp.]|nr:MAG: TonB-dependent receptor [Rhodanobacter sp.]TAM39322.1 MAG: TonB-dependent receptor [Rhodanobacter sp.]TAN23323.1 MAG: TonB-dependent receptor [Rhodanobacter sp.]
MRDFRGVVSIAGHPPRRLPAVVIAALLACAGCAAHAAEGSGDAVTSTASGSAGAQPASPASAARPRAVTLGEVIVSANLRREPSREVPMHVDTLSATRLQAIGAKTLADYVAYQPGVFFASQGGPGEGTLIMRGVSTGNQTSPTVAVYVDDVPIGGSTVYSAAATYVFDAAMMDLDHVEFLFGPQGTLYGAGSMGGLVKYVTHQPDTSAFSGSAGLELAHGQRGGLDTGEHLTLNMPLVKDVAALRVSAVNQHTTGLYRAVGETPSAHADSNHTRGVRAQLEVYPTSRLSFNVSAMAQQIAADGLSMSDYSLAGQPLSGGAYNRRLNHREPFTQTLQLYVFRADYELDWGHLDWISSYQTFVNRAVQDYPDVFLGLLNQLGPAFGVDQKLTSLYIDSTYAVHKAAQEIRITSKRNDQVDWLAGVWFSREDAWENFALQGANLLPPPGLSRLLRQDVSSRFQEYAGYGDATWHLTPVVNLTFGARLSGNTQTLSNFEDGPVAGSPGGFREHMISYNTTKMLTASYQPDKMRSYYVRASTGYRPGGLQAPVTSTVFGSNEDVTNRFGSDTLTSYEAGFKGHFADYDLSMGADVYDIEWHNLQVPTYTVGNAVIVNVGDARINGMELQSSYKPGNFQFDGSLAWTYGRMVNVRPGSGISVGAPLPYSARWNASLRARYDLKLFGDAAHVGASLRAASHRHAGFDGSASDPDFDLPGHALLDLDAGMQLHGGVRVGVYVRNVLDRRVPVGTLNTQTVGFLAAVGGPMLVHQTTPRSVGVLLDVPFK